MMPDWPSTMTWRASSNVAPISPISQPAFLRAMVRIHSAPVRVLPNPRPAINSQHRHAPVGGSWA